MRSKRLACRATSCRVRNGFGGSNARHLTCSLSISNLIAPTLWGLVTFAVRVDSINPVAGNPEPTTLVIIVQLHMLKCIPGLWVFHALMYFSFCSRSMSHICLFTGMTTVALERCSSCLLHPVGPKLGPLGTRFGRRCPMPVTFLQSAPRW